MLQLRSHVRSTSDFVWVVVWNSFGSKLLWWLIRWICTVPSPLLQWAWWCENRKPAIIYQHWWCHPLLHLNYTYTGSCRAQVMSSEVFAERRYLTGVQLLIWFYFEILFTSSEGVMSSWCWGKDQWEDKKIFISSICGSLHPPLPPLSLKGRRKHLIFKPFKLILCLIYFIAAAHLILRTLIKDRFGFGRSSGAASIPVFLLDIQIIASTKSSVKSLFQLLCLF